MPLEEAASWHGIRGHFLAVTRGVYVYLNQSLGQRVADSDADHYHLLLLNFLVLELLGLLVRLWLATIIPNYRERETCEPNCERDASLGRECHCCALLILVDRKCWYLYINNAK